MYPELDITYKKQQYKVSCKDFKLSKKVMIDCAKSIFGWTFFKISAAKMFKYNFRFSYLFAEKKLLAKAAT